MIGVKCIDLVEIPFLRRTPYPATNLNSHHCRLRPVDSGGPIPAEKVRASPDVIARCSRTEAVPRNRVQSDVPTGSLRRRRIPMTQDVLLVST
jgi:hypothetical protein